MTLISASLFMLTKEVIGSTDLGVCLQMVPYCVYCFLLFVLFCFVGHVCALSGSIFSHLLIQ